MSKQPTEPRRDGWTCLWETCPDKGQKFYPPPGRTQLEDCHHHHRTVHGVQPDRPGIHFPERRPR